MRAYGAEQNRTAGKRLDHELLSRQSMELDDGTEKACMTVQRPIYSPVAVVSDRAAHRRAGAFLRTPSDSRFLPKECPTLLLQGRALSELPVCRTRIRCILSINGLRFLFPGANGSSGKWRRNRDPDDQCAVEVRRRRRKETS